MLFAPMASGGGISLWVTITTYAVNDLVLYNKYVYVCIVAHTAGASIEADITGGKWAIMNTPIRGQNLVTYGNSFEDNDTGNWTACGCATVTNGFPASVGSGGAAFSSSNGGRAKNANTTAPAIVSSGQIAGQYSMNFATSGAGAIGDMYISAAYPIDICYQAQVLSFEIKYKSVSGAPVMAGTSSNTYAVAIYDVVNNAWIQPPGCFNFIQSSGVGIAKGTFQTSSNMTSFQIAIYNPVAPVGASSLYYDDVFVGPQTVSYGAAMSDWTAWTPTGTWSTNTTYTGWYRRDGDSLRMVVKLALAGAPTSASLTFTLPNGLNIDTTKLPGTPTNQVVGQITGQGAAHTFSGVAMYGSTTTIGAFYTLDGSTASIMSYAAITQAAPYTFANNDFIYIYTNPIPIVGWSSNVIMSSDANTFVVASMVSGASGSTTANNAIVYASTNYDTTGGWVSSTTYNISVSGYYEINARCASSSGAGNLQIYANGVLDSSPYYLVQYAATSTAVSGSITKYYISGTAITIRPDTTTTFVGGAPANNLTIKKISGPSQIASSESVNALYTGAPPTGTLTTAYNTTTYGTKVKDSHNAYSGGSYTIPVSGTYSIQASNAQAGTYALNKIAIVAIFIDGNQSYTNICPAGGVNGTLYPDVTVHSVPLLAGQVVTVRSYNDSTSPTFGSVANQNFFSIVRTGNY